MAAAGLVGACSSNGRSTSPTSSTTLSLKDATALGLHVGSAVLAASSVELCVNGYLIAHLPDWKTFTDAQTDPFDLYIQIAKVHADVERRALNECHVA